VNKRITLLALKASDSKTGWLDRQKFAQLIVQECAKVILETSVQYNEIDTMHRIRDNVKAHFGVEE
jgi:hypothetical protein